MITNVAAREATGGFMRTVLATALALAVSAAEAGTADGHFHMLLPAAPTAKRGEAVAVTCRWGHPFEHQLFDALVPQAWFVLAPDGSKTDLLPLCSKDPDQKQTAFRARFTPRQRGDYTLIMRSPAVWMAEDAEYLQDTVKVVLHVQAQKGWDVPAGQPFEMLPLTRPYGLRAGTVFQAQAVADGKPLAGALVEIERYNPSPPKLLPPDEQITHTAKADPNGVVTATLGEPGWWCLTAARPGGHKERAGKSYPVRQRATIWVYVDARPVAEK
jgi:cobalt/nickel transport protein